MYVIYHIYIDIYILQYVSCSYSRFSHFWEQDESFISPNFSGFLTPFFFYVTYRPNIYSISTHNNNIII